jgi:hypothetical protein
MTVRDGSRVKIMKANAFFRIQLHVASKGSASPIDSSYRANTNKVLGILP